MKPTYPSLCLLFICTIANSVSAAAAADRPGDAARELQAVEQFLELSNEQLDQLIAALTRIRAMDSAQRDALAAEIIRFRTLPEDRRRQMRDHWKGTGHGHGRPEDIDSWRLMMSSLPADQRERIQETLQSLPPAEKPAFRRKQLLDWQQRVPE
jgi:hypothetical protein